MFSPWRNCFQFPGCGVFHVLKIAGVSGVLSSRWHSCSEWSSQSIKNWMGPYHRTFKEVAIELLDTQVFSGSVQWVLLEISWSQLILKKKTGGAYQELAPWPTLSFLFEKQRGMAFGTEKIETWAEYWMNEEEDEDKEEYDYYDDFARCSWMDRSMFLLNHCCWLQRWDLIHVRDLIPKPAG